MIFAVIEWTTTSSVGPLPAGRWVRWGRVAPNPGGYDRAIAIGLSDEPPVAWRTARSVYEWVDGRWRELGTGAAPCARARAMLPATHSDLPAAGVTAEEEGPIPSTPRFDGVGRIYDGDDGVYGPVDAVRAALAEAA